MRNYHINIFYSDEDEAYIADIPDLTYCSTISSTSEKAVREVQIAKSAWLEAAKASGRPLSVPLYRPVIYQAVS